MTRFNHFSFCHFRQFVFSPFIGSPFIVGSLHYEFLPRPPATGQFANGRCKQILILSNHICSTLTRRILRSEPLHRLTSQALSTHHPQLFLKYLPAAHDRGRTSSSVDHNHPSSTHNSISLIRTAKGGDQMLHSTRSIQVPVGRAEAVTNLTMRRGRKDSALFQSVDGSSKISKLIC